MPEADKHSKTEQASHHKLRKSREQGQVASSKDLSSTVSLILGMIMFAVMLPSICKGFQELFYTIVNDFDYGLVAPNGVNYIVAYTFKSFIRLGLPIIVVTWLAALLTTIAQVGFHFSVKPLEPSLDKLNPIKGFQRLFSTRGLINMLTSLAKMIVVACVTSSVIMNRENTLVLLNLNDISYVLNKSGAMIWELAWKASFVLLVLAIIDFVYQKWQFNEDQKMTKQEVKDESKQHEGNPEIKGRIRSIQRSAAQKRGLRETVAEADVIVTNPFHIAVAIKYDREGGQAAPRVIAKGARLLAQRIRGFAQDSGIEIIQNIPLARALYKQVKVGFEIPPELYIAVAEVLAIVFRKKGKL